MGWLGSLLGLGMAPLSLVLKTSVTQSSEGLDEGRWLLRGLLWFLLGLRRLRLTGVCTGSIPPSWCLNCRVCHRVSLVSILLRVFPSMFNRDPGLRFSFLVVSLESASG